MEALKIILLSLIFLVLTALVSGF